MVSLLFTGDTESVSQLQSDLERSGYEVIVRTNPDEATDMIRAERPPLIFLSDPGEGGVSLCRHWRQLPEANQSTLLVLLVEHDLERISAYREAGADDYILAPWETERLLPRIVFARHKSAERVLRREVEEELKRRVGQQAILSELGRRVLAGAGIPEALDFAVRATREVLNIDLCAVFELLSDENTLVLRATSGSRIVEGSRILLQAMPGLMKQPGGPVIFSGTHEPLTNPDLAELNDARAGMAVCISGEDVPFGLMAALSSAERVFSDDDRHFVQAVSNLLAAIIERTHSEDALRESVATIRAIVETTVDGIITISEAGLIESFNPAAERIFGYRADEVIGLNVSVLMPEPYKEEHDTYMRNYLETGHRKIIGIGREVVGLHKSGRTFPLDLAVSEVRFSDRRIFTGIVRDITERRRLEQELLEISEQERRRIGQDLHDGLGQMLTGIGLISRNVARRLEKTEPPAAVEVGEITDLIKEADQYARGLARGLVPVELDAGGLSAALFRLASHAERLFGIECTFEEIGTPLMYNNTAATHLYRIAQEAVSNAVKHGQAGRVTITLAGGEDQVRLRVQDNGTGFPEVLGENRGMGVRIMHHRARMIGATLEIRRVPEGGTVLTCTLPRGNKMFYGAKEYRIRSRKSIS